MLFDKLENKNFTRFKFFDTIHGIEFSKNVNLNKNKFKIIYKNFN